MDQLEQARAFFLQALEHHNHQRLTEAEALYRQALTLMPERISVLNNLAAVLIGQSRFAEALALCERAAAIEPGHPDTRANAATCRRELAGPEHALQVLDAATQADPDDIGAHANRAGILQGLGRWDQALAGYERALALDPDNTTLLVNRGGVLARLGRLDGAFACFDRALRIDPQLQQAGEGFIWLMTAFGYLPRHRDAQFEALVIRAISEPWARPQAVAPVLLALLRADAVIGAGIERVASRWPEPLPSAEALPPADFAAVVASRLLPALLENATVADPGVEHWLGMLRAELLQHGTGSDTRAPDAGQLTLHCALARQCFINEYVYSAQPGEHAVAERLYATLVDAIAHGESFPADALAAVACYFPLSGVPEAARLLERAWPAAVEAMLTQQLREPLQELALGGDIRRLTGIDDAVSRQVRQQYEENPYPRWVATPRVHRSESLEGYLRRRVPTGAWRRAADENAAVEALNAGCGTGQNPIETAQRIANIRVLAVDLSRASLGYGARMAQRLGVANVEFAQADILELASMPQRFDLIESTGVIHHLQDPAQGLRILGSLLKPDGVMKLALYSQAARRSVVAARALIAARGYNASAPDIRHCREMLMRMDPGAPERQVIGFSDFYSLSECRDLLFHVQEHRFTIPRIKVLLAEAGLGFIGFEQHPGDRHDDAGMPSPDTLDGWDEWEHRHPDTFAGMYQFWMQKLPVA